MYINLYKLLLLVRLLNLYLETQLQFKRCDVDSLWPKYIYVQEPKPNYTEMKKLVDKQKSLNFTQI